MTKFIYDNVEYASKSECIEALGLKPKSTFESASRLNLTVEEYLDQHFKKYGKRGVMVDGIKYRSVKDAFKIFGYTQDDYQKFMIAKKQKKDSGEIKNKADEEKFLEDVLLGRVDTLKKVYGRHIIDGIEYSSIEKMVESFGYTLEQYNIYKRYRKLTGDAVDIFNQMRQDESFKTNYTKEVEYKGKTYPSIKALTESLNYEYGIFTSRMYQLGLTAEEFLQGIEEGKYEEPKRKRVLHHKKINYIINGKGYTTQEQVAKALGMAKVTVLHKAKQNGLTFEEMARQLMLEKEEKENSEEAVTN